MSRPYFKNDLYHHALQREQAAIRTRQREETAKQTPKATKRKQMPILEVDTPVEKVVEAQEEEEDDYEDMLKSLSKKSNSENRNILANGYLPKSTLVVKEEPKVEAKKTDEEERLEKKKQNISYKKFENQVKYMMHGKRQPEGEPKEGEEVEQPKEKQQEENEDKSAEEEDGKKPGKVEKQGAWKTKRIKKQNNYVRLDLKRKYKDRFLGALNNNIRKYNRNGTLKPKYRAQSELTIQDGEIYNTYITSLSKALCMDIPLEDQDEPAGSDSDSSFEIPAVVVPKEWTREALQAYLKRAFKFEDFREGQFQTISNILKGKSTVFISETASGKSLCYIMSSMLLGGLSLVISPLVSLMLDQLAHLPQDLPAACISSLLNRQQRERIIKLVHAGKINLLFLTPQCLQTDFIYHLQDFPEVHFTCVDEAHSLSELSHNFRTSFLALGDIVQNLIRYKYGKPNILALTATANPETVSSIQNKLSINDVIRSTSCLNKNLYVTISRERGMNKCESLIRYLNHQQIGKCKGILIYTRTRKIMQEVFNFVSNSTSFSVAIYHSALSNKEKTETLNKFRFGDIKIVVATVALGMGLDFAHLECVIHMNMPKSIENYVQEIGRAGRRQKRAYCHLFLDDSDYFTERNYIIADQIDASTLTLLYKQLRDHSVVRVQKEKYAKPTKSREEEEQLVIKRASILIEHCVRDSVIEEEQYEESYPEGEEEGVARGERVNSRLFSIRVAKLTESTALREEAVLTLLLKIQSLLKGGETQFKVLPIANQTLKIGFFRNNEEQLKRDDPFLKELLSNCKKVKGTTYVNLIDKCNAMSLRPIHLLTKLYRIGNEHMLKIEQDMPVFVWQFIGNRENRTQQEEDLNEIVNRGFRKLQGESQIERVVHEMNEVQHVSLIKLNVLYSLTFIHSRNHINNILANHIIPPEQPIPNESIAKEFDRYFRDSLQNYYNRITDNGQEGYIPAEMIQPKDLSEIFNSIALFFKHQLANMDLRSQRQIYQARKQLVQTFGDGKIITKILMGVNSGEVSWKIYGERSYWMLFRKKNYEELIDTVKVLVKRYGSEFSEPKQKPELFLTLPDPDLLPYKDLQKQEEEKQVENQRQPQPQEEQESLGIGQESV